MRDYSELELIAENKALKAKTETYCTYGDEGSEHTFYGDQAAIAALTALVFEVEALRKAAELAAKKLRSAEICHPRAVEALLGEAREALAAYLPAGWPKSEVSRHD